MAVRTYGSLKLSRCRSFWVVERAEPHVSIRLKQIFPKIQKAASPPYRMSRSISTDADLDWFMDRYPMEMADKDRKLLQAGSLGFKQQQAELEQILLPDYRP